MPSLVGGLRKTAVNLAAVVITAVSLLAPPASGQRVSLGVVVGGYANDDFDSRYTPYPGFFPSITEPDSGGYVIGPALDVRLFPRLSIGVEALYKPLHYRAAAEFSWEGAVLGFAPATVVTWQFPVLARYRFSLGRLRPFLEGGPSFRATGNLNSSDPSHFGVTAGAGVETEWRRLRIAPRVRYTRWAEDSRRADVRTRSDQVEFLVGFSYAAAVNTHPLGRRISLGAVIGPDVSSESELDTSTFPDFYAGSPITTRATLGPGRLVLGPLLEFSVSPHLSIEGNAISSSRVNKRTLTGLGQVRKSSTAWAAPWEFPVLAKYRLATGSVRPFLTLGPSFRLPNGPGGDRRSIYGATAGVGLEIRAKRVRISPTLRYTRWGPDRLPVASGDPRNQMHLLVGVSF